MAKTLREKSLSRLSEDRGEQKVQLAFKDIRYDVRVKKETKHILKGVSGCVDGGEMLCCLGPSGSGKTSLIHVIASKLKTAGVHSVEGAVLCNGRELRASEFQRLAGLVTQEDVFNGALSVRETLLFAARLRLPRALRKERIDSVVEVLQLGRCYQTMVGDDSNPYHKGISGGEKRRLAIAMELLDPNMKLLVLDEPTSGLDAAAALNVVNTLQFLAQRGLTVVCTLHQPRYSIMERFQKLMVLSQGRRCFYGPLGAYVPYLEGELRCELPPHASPYDMLLDALNPAIPQEEGTLGLIPEGCEDVTGLLADAFDKSELCRRMDAQQPPPASDGEAPEAAHSSVSCADKFMALLMRTFLEKLRDPMVLATQLSSALMIGSVFGLIYFRVYEKSTTFALLDAMMAVSMTVIMVAYMPYDVTLTFAKERRIFLRERKAGLYSTLTFYAARVVADMPMHILASGVEAAIVYGLAGLRMGFHHFLGLCVFGVLVGAAIMQAIGALCRSFEDANLLMMLVMMMSMMMTSSFVREVPSWLSWARDVSYMGLLGDLGLYLEFRDADPALGTPEEIFSTYGMKIQSPGQAWSAVLTLVAIYAVARLITYLAVKFLHTGRTFSENLMD